MALSLVNAISYVFFGVLTIIFSGWIVLTYLSHKELRQHPAGLIAWVGLFEIILGYHSIIFAIGAENFAEYFNLPRTVALFTCFTADQQSIRKGMCYSNQFILAGSCVGVITGNIVICLELICSLWNPFRTGSTRVKVYIIAQLLAILYFASYTCFLNGFINDCDGTQFQLEVSNLPPIMFLLIAYLCVAVFSCVYAGICFYRGLLFNTELARKYFIRHIWYVASFTLLWIWPAMSYILRRFGDGRNEVVDSIAVAAVASSGVVLGLIRASEPAIWARLRRCSLMGGDLDTPDMTLKRPLSVIVSGNLNSQMADLIYLALHTIYVGYKEDPRFSLRFKKFRTHRIKDYTVDKEELGLQTDAPEVIISEYHFQAFHSIITQAGLSIEEIANSLDPQANSRSVLGGTQGKSGSCFLFTHDNKLAIKTIKSKERRTMIRLVKKYRAHCKSFERSCLCRVFGIFTLKVPGVVSAHLMVMENVQFGVVPEQVFDLKGSLRGRTAFRHGRWSGPYKDLDFKHMDVDVDLHPEEEEQLCVQITRDVKLLQKHRVIDYSLLLLVSPATDQLNRYSYRSTDQQHVYTVVIIDYLIAYDYFKFLEEKFSSKGASVKRPRDYANRFINFMFSAVFSRRRTTSSISWSHMIDASSFATPRQ